MHNTQSTMRAQLTCWATGRPRNVHAKSEVSVWNGCHQHVWMSIFCHWQNIWWQMIIAEAKHCWWIFVHGLSANGSDSTKSHAMYLYHLTKFLCGLRTDKNVITYCDIRSELHITVAMAPISKAFAPPLSLSAPVVPLFSYLRHLFQC